MKNKLIVTEDGSHTMFSGATGENYHSIHGAIQESMTVFIQSGLEAVQKERISILEMGFGSGLNALLSLDFARKNEINIDYESLELHPITSNDAKLLNYPELLKIDKQDFLHLHSCPWEQVVSITDEFNIRKLNIDIKDFIPERIYDLVYYDAFSPDSQPELWEENIFNKIYPVMKTGGILCTYSVRGDFRRILKSLGFRVEKLPGPPGKRHITRATKLD